MPCGLEVPDHRENLDDQDEGDDDSACGSQPIDPAPFLGPQVEQHDDEKEKHHHRACVNQHLNDSNKVGVERHEQRGETKERNDKAERACDRIAIENDGRAENQHQ